jgi:peptidoglycan/LPS O-acetylase OafA/YrhL
MQVPTKTDSHDISVDLTWIDMLRGIAIIGVFYDNWIHYMQVETSPALLYYSLKFFAFAVGPFVQVFFLLSGFGLTLAFLSQTKSGWSWKRWTWRRITKIILPYEIFVIFSFIIGIAGSSLYESVNVEFSWVSLLSYVTFTRNFYAPSWVWNLALWFMPCIIGLYISFPVLIKILKKWGPLILLLISALTTYGTLVLAAMIGWPKAHFADIFTFWIIQFALGMALAYARESNAEKLRYLLGAKAFATGVGLLMFSLAIRTYVPGGNRFNDSLTTAGIFLVLLNLGWSSRIKFPAIGRALNALSRESYFMYLVHFPIMGFLIGPLILTPINAIVVLALGGLYIVMIYFLCRLISPPINKLVSWAYSRYQA